MRHAPRVLQVVLAALVGLVVGLVWLARSGEETSIRPSRSLEAHTDVTPDTHVFGQPVVATAQVLVDATDIDPRSVRIDTDFAPYQLAGRRTVDRRVSHGIGVVTFRFPLRCLKEGCDTSGARGVAEFETGRVVYRYRSGAGDAFVALDWPPFEVASRVSDDDVEQINWRAAERTLPAVGYRVAPTRLAVLLFAVAALMAACALLLARRLWRPEPEESAPGQVPVQTRLERAVSLARNASLDGDLPLRRRALERLAQELGAVNRPDLEEEARMLAWSAEGSTVEQVESLARRVEDGAA